MMESLHKFPQKYATVGTNWRRFFDKDGGLKKIKELKHFPLEEVLLKTYRFKYHEAKEFAKFLKPMLNIFPEKRATAADALQARWLNGKTSTHLCTDDQEVEENIRTFMESKSAHLYFRNLKDFNSDQYDGDAEGDMGSHNTDSEDDHLGWQNKRPNANQYRERNFTNTYVGYDEGIDVDALDSTANWQFGKNKVLKKYKNMKNKH